MLVYIKSIYNKCNYAKRTRSANHRIFLDIDIILTLKITSEEWTDSLAINNSKERRSLVKRLQNNVSRLKIICQLLSLATTAIKVVLLKFFL